MLTIFQRFSAGKNQGIYWTWLHTLLAVLCLLPRAQLAFLWKVAPTLKPALHNKLKAKNASFGDLGHSDFQSVREFRFWLVIDTLVSWGHTGGVNCTHGYIHISCIPSLIVIRTSLVGSECLMVPTFDRHNNSMNCQLNAYSGRSYQITNSTSF